MNKGHRYKNMIRDHNYQIVSVYKDVLDHIHKTGMGNKTRFGTKVTQQLIDNIIDRLFHLKTHSDIYTIERKYNEER